MDGLTLRAEDLGALTPELLDRVAGGEAVEITRGGAVVAKVVATDFVPSEPKIDKHGLADRLRATREEANRRGHSLTLDEIHKLRNDRTA